MPEETQVVAGSDSTAETQPVNPEASKPAEPQEVGEGADPQGTPEQGEQEHERKRKGGWQRKIERLEMEREFLMQELLKRKSQPEPSKPAAPSAEASDPEPNESDFENLKDYVKAQAKWEARQIVKSERQKLEAEQKAQSAKSEEQKQLESWNKQIAAARDKYDDMDEALEAPIPITPTMRAELLRSDVAGELAYYLGKHPEVAEQIAKLTSESAVARAFGRIEAQFARQESAEQKKEEPKQVDPPPPPVTKAPKPPTPVTKPSTSGVIDLNDPNVSQKDWLKAREAQLKRK